MSKSEFRESVSVSEIPYSVIPYTYLNIVKNLRRENTDTNKQQNMCPKMWISMKYS